LIIKKDLIAKGPPITRWAFVLIFIFYSITCGALAPAAAWVVAADEVAAHVGHAVAGFAAALLFGPVSFFAAAGHVVVEPASVAAAVGHVAEFVADCVGPAFLPAYVHVAVAARHCYEPVAHAGLRPAGFLLPGAEHCFLLPEPFDWHYFVLPVVFLLPVDWRYFARFAVSLLFGKTTDLPLHEHAALNVADLVLPWQLSPDGHDLLLQKAHGRRVLPAHEPFVYSLAVCGARPSPFVLQDAALPSHPRDRHCSLRDCLQPYCVV